MVVHDTGKQYGWGETEMMRRCAGWTQRRYQQVYWSPPPIGDADVGAGAGSVPAGAVGALVGVPAGEPAAAWPAVSAGGHEAFFWSAASGLFGSIAARPLSASAPVSSPHDAPAVRSAAAVSAVAGSDVPVAALMTDPMAAPGRPATPVVRSGDPFPLAPAANPIVPFAAPGRSTPPIEPFGETLPVPPLENPTDPFAAPGWITPPTF